MLDKFQKTISILGTFIILNGTLYLYIFYKDFGINIFSYLDFTEVLTAFLNYAPGILFFFFIYLLHLFIPVLILDKLFDWLKTKFLFGKNDKKNVERGFNFAFYLQLLVLILTLILMKTNVWCLSEKTIYLTVFLTMNLFQRVISFFEKSIKEIVGLNYYDPFFYIMVFGVPFTAFTILFSYSNASDKKISTQYVTLVDNQGKTSTFNRNNKLVGKTNHYMFFYNIKTKESLSINLADIKTIKYY